MAESALSSSRTQILNNLQTMRTFEKDCLQGMLDCELHFQAFVATNPTPENYKKAFEKVTKIAMINTYGLLYVQNLATETMTELSALDAKNAVPMKTENPSTGEHEIPPKSSV